MRDIDQALGQIDHSVLQHSGYQTVLIVLFTLGFSSLHESCPDIGLQFIQSVKLADILYKVVIQLRQLLLLDGVDAGLDTAGLPARSVA